MIRPRKLRALLAGGATAATLLGCGAEKTQPDTASTPAPTSTAAPTSAPEPGKSAEPAPAATATTTPAVSEQPAAPTATPADAAKDKAKAGTGEVKKETPPHGR